MHFQDRLDSLIQLVQVRQHLILQGFDFIEQRIGSSLFHRTPGAGGGLVGLVLHGPAWHVWTVLQASSLLFRRFHRQVNSEFSRISRGCDGTWGEFSACSGDPRPEKPVVRANRRLPGLLFMRSLAPGRNGTERVDITPRDSLHCQARFRLLPVSVLTLTKGSDVVKLTVRDRESIQEAVRRFRKLVERSGIKKEMRRREYYEKPSEVKRRARLRAERRNRRSRLLGEI